MPALPDCLPRLLTVGQHIRGVVEEGNVGDTGANGLHHTGALSRGVERGCAVRQPRMASKWVCNRSSGSSSSGGSSSGSRKNKPHTASWLRAQASHHQHGASELEDAGHQQGLLHGQGAGRHRRGKRVGHILRAVGRGWQQK